MSDTPTPLPPEKTGQKTAKTPATKRPTLKKNMTRAQNLVESMLTTMEEGLACDASSEQWHMLFGDKDSAVISLQKLVQVIGLLAAQVEASRPEKAAPPRQATLSREEIDMLSEWLLAGEGAVGD